MAFNKLVLIPFLAIGLYFLKKYMNGGICTSDARLDGKTIIVTGANAGIGKETVRDLARRGGHVIMGCRSQYRCNAAANEIRQENSKADLVLMTLDLSSFKSIREFVTEFKQKEKNLHILINNAGVMWTPYQKTEDGFEMQFGVNHLGHFMLTTLLLDVIKASKPSRIINVSSLAHNGGTMDFDTISDPGEENYSKNSAYGSSKLANILYTRELAKRLKGTGVSVATLHPGVVDSELMRYVSYADHPIIRAIFWPVRSIFMKTTVQGSQTTLCCALNDDIPKLSGKYFSDCAVKEPSAAAQNDEDAKKLWDLSMKWTGLEKEAKI
ncbi:unnamed protein product [Owenia fusiformis]|uniref:Uncharacterized protein n=1 Tax=Owenia fusiformis TaxID=6347 RepID=A0A8J1XXU5_OWEFU|nr:unnamed protein product [Owenia fusiformis]